MSRIQLRRLLAAASFAVILTASVSVASAQAPTSGWRMPNLNPFASKSSAPANNGGRSTLSKVVDPFGLIPGTGGKATTASFGRQVPQQPSTWQKMTNGTKRMASQTADFLNPFDDGPAPKYQENVTGSNTMFSQQANGRMGAGTEQKQSWLPGWGAPRPADKDTSVNSFLARPKPQP